MEAVRDQVVAVIIERLTEELGHGIGLTVSAHRDSEKIADLGGLASRKMTRGEMATFLETNGPWELLVKLYRGIRAAQRGEARLRFRPTGDPNLFRFLADGHLEHDRRNPTYSGFIVEGHVTRDELTGADTAEFRNWVVKHNDPEWAYW